MDITRKNGSVSNILRCLLRNSSTFVGLTGLAYSASGLIISTICDNEATPTTYTADGMAIETIATLGTFAAPTSGKCRFREVDSTNHPGLYELQIADLRFAVANAKVMHITISGAANLLTKDITVQFENMPIDDQSPQAFALKVVSAAPYDYLSGNYYPDGFVNGQRRFRMLAPAGWQNLWLQMGTVGLYWQLNNVNTGVEEPTPFKASPFLIGTWADGPIISVLPIPATTDEGNRIAKESLIPEAFAFTSHRVNAAIDEDSLVDTLADAVAAKVNRTVSVSGDDVTVISR